MKTVLRDRTPSEMLCNSELRLATDVWEKRIDSLVFRAKYFTSVSKYRPTFANQQYATPYNMHLHQNPAICTFTNSLQYAPSSTPCNMHFHQLSAICTFINSLQYAPTSTPCNMHLHQLPVRRSFINIPVRTSNTAR